MIDIKFLRENKGYTQQEMADILGITQQAYSNKEVGKRGFNTKELLILAIISLKYSRLSS